MLYHLLAPLADEYILFNLFNYITFRAAGAMLTALFRVLVGPTSSRDCAPRKSDSGALRRTGEPSGKRARDHGRLIISGRDHRDAALGAARIASSW